ncbi:hypothetical protein [Ramlibacter montanisoli]|uniref:Uncharacterized protein n=1 Tax=Ramlibacter montanisoli TaxID=2732512 RepID=A0A849K586_9BURK|nr:hypothetical protein [Ramlibacter montanisoli]NNU43572.1 hypothetical protein [Ramlibacter montanisoli]
MLMVKAAVVLSNRIGGPSVRNQLQTLLDERGLHASPSTLTAIMQRVTSKLFPGEKASYLSDQLGYLTQLWLPELPLKIRRRRRAYFLF